MSDLSAGRSWRSGLQRAGFSEPLDTGFFVRPADQVAPDLLGCGLFSLVDGVLTGGRIVETEAYLGREDEGSHACTKGMTARNAVMYGPPATVYVYLTYGVHHMLNLVCEPEGVAGAVLVRAIEPLAGVEAMAARRRRRGRGLASGPGRLAQALGVDLADNGSALGQGRLAVAARTGDAGPVTRTGRIGLSRGHEAQLRFFLAGDPFVSSGKLGPVRSR